MSIFDQEIVDLVKESDSESISEDQPEEIVTLTLSFSSNQGTDICVCASYSPY